MDSTQEELLLRPGDRDPTVKAEHAAPGRALSGLLLTYPIHQATDILFCKSNLVLVGKTTSRSSK